ncbi:hypothetical protein CDL15_Pgr012925 [Punica granatum]|nr:hypothetical protein CDL15_Pgr012925 [Punica granatum]
MLREVERGIERSPWTSSSSFFSLLLLCHCPSTLFTSAPLKSCQKTTKLLQAAGSFVGGSNADEPRDGGVNEEEDGLASINGGDGDNDDGDGDGDDGDDSIGGGDRSDGGGDKFGREMAMETTWVWRWRGLGEGDNSAME